MIVSRKAPPRRVGDSRRLEEAMQIWRAIHFEKSGVNSYCKWNCWPASSLCQIHLEVAWFASIVQVRDVRGTIPILTRDPVLCLSPTGGTL